MTLHTYAIIDSSNQIDEPIYGLEGARVYNVPYCDIGAIVSEFATGSAQDITKQSVLAHEEIIERLMERFTVLPVGFHTVYDGWQGLLAMMQSYYRDFKENLDKLSDKVEFGIKVIWPSKAVKQHIVKTCRKASVPTDSPNIKFMRHKIEQYRLNEELEKKADKFISLMDIFFSKFAARKETQETKDRRSAPRCGLPR